MFTPIPAAVRAGANAAHGQSPTAGLADAEPGLIANPQVSGAERISNKALDVVESPAVSYAIAGGMTAYGAYSAGAAAGGSAALAAAGVVAVAALGVASAYLGSKVGDWISDTALADGIFTSVMGGGKIATEGEAPARKGDPIAHQNKNLAVAAALLGAVACIAVGVLTGGAGFVVMAAAVAATGFATGVVLAIASKAGQYGANKGQILEGSANVNFENKPVARVGDAILCSDHPGSPPPVIAEGAKTVFANRKNIARIGHRTTCDANINGGCKTIAQTLQTSQVYEVQDSRSGLLRWAAFLSQFIPVGKLREKFGKTEPTHTLSGQGKGCSTGKCTKAGEPVDMGTGDFLQQWPLLDIPGTIALQLNRTYRSTAAYRGVFGVKWADDWGQTLVLDTQTVTYHSAEGFSLEYHTPHNDVYAGHLREGQWVLEGQRNGTLRLRNRHTQLRYVFESAQETSSATRRLRQICDTSGNHIDFAYGPGGLACITHSDGYTLRVDSQQGRIRRVQAMEGAGLLHEAILLECEYQAGYIVRCASYQFAEVRHQYDANGYMLSWADCTSTQAHIRYDARGRVLATQVLAAAGHNAYHEDSFAYDDQARCNTYFDAAGGSTRYWYNQDGLITRMQDPNGAITSTQWSDTTQKLSQTDAAGRTTRFTWSELCDLQAITYPDGKQARFAYSLGGLLLKATHANGNTWSYSYDGQGRCDVAIDPTQARTLYRHAPNGRVLRVTHPTGEEIRYEYDARQRLSRIHAPDGATHSLAFDLFGRLLWQQDPLGQASHYSYAAHAHPSGSVAQITDPQGHHTRYTYTSENLVASVQDANGQTTRYGYGALDKLLHIRSPSGQTTRLFYDSLQRLSQVINPEGLTWRYHYDRAGRLAQETDFAGIERRYAYDVLGRCSHITQGDGSWQRFAYNEDDQIIRIDWGAAGQDTPIQTHQFSYDAKGYLHTAQNAHALIEFERDALGRILSETLNGRKVEQHKHHHRTTAVTLPGHSAIHYQYDSNGLLQGIQVNQHSALQLLRDMAGRETTRTSAQGFALHQQYTASGQLQAQLAGAHRSTAVPHNPTSASQPGVIPGAIPGIPPTPTSIPTQYHVQRRFEYDPTGNPLAIHDTHWGENRYTYTADGQVSTSRIGQGGGHSLHEHFNYQHGQLTQTSSSEQGWQQPGAPHTQFQVFGRGRLASRGPWRYEYDARGRMVQKSQQRNGFRPQTTRYGWSEDDRLTSVTTPQGEHWQYQYDPFGRRISKRKTSHHTQRIIQTPQDLQELQEQQTQPGRAAQAIIGTQYLYAQGQLLQEAPLYADGTVAWDKATHWVYTPDGLTPLARHKDGQLAYVVSDHLGTPRELMSEQGNVIWRSNHSTWGQRHNPHNPWAKAANDEECPHVFAGQYHDPETGLHYNFNRYYDPQTGQYLSSDPIGLLGGMRAYGYVDNPNSWIDPWGLVGCDPIKKLQDLGYNNVKRNDRGGLDYSESNALYRNNARLKSDGSPVQSIVEIKYTGNYQKDFELASQAGFGQPSTPSGYVWHHLDNYNPETGIGTMQLVERGAHIGIPHYGGAAQYFEHTGSKYVFDSWK